MSSSQHAFFLAWVVEFGGSRAYSLQSVMNMRLRTSSVPVTSAKISTSLHSATRVQLVLWEQHVEMVNDLKLHMATRDHNFELKNTHPPDLAFLKIVIVWVMRYFENHLGQINQIVCICLTLLKWCCTNIYWMKMSTNNFMLLIKARSV